MRYITAQDEPTNQQYYGELGAVLERIGDSTQASSQYSSQGLAVLREAKPRYKLAVSALAKAFSLAPSRCEYGYWQADAMHQR